MEQMVKRSNYHGQKFLIENLKTDKKSVLSYNGVLKTFGVSGMWKDRTVKTYYDTPDMFFRKKGINISIDTFSNKSMADLVVRYDSHVKRANFIGNIPDTFIKKINKRQSITPNFNYIATAVLELMPQGLNIDIFETVRYLQPIMVVRKSRERYRIIHNSGLKMVFSFEKNTYTSVKTKQKHSQPMLDIRLESSDDFAPAFKEFVKKLHMQQHMFIKEKHSDLFVGLEYIEV